MKKLKLKWMWDILKLALGLLAAVALGLSRIPDRPVPGYVPPTASTAVPTIPAVAGIAQADWIFLSVIFGIGAASAVAIDGAWNLHKAKKVKIDEAVRAEVRRIILGVLKTLSENTHINIVYLGGSVFLYKKSRKGFRLESFERFRLDDYPPRSSIEWVGAKGAIGLAVQRRTTVHCNWVALSKQLKSPQGASDGTLATLAPEVRLGFKNEELRELAPRYFESLATPILSVDGSKLLGVLAIDIPNREDLEMAEALLGARDVEEKLAVPAAGLIARTMDPA